MSNPFTPKPETKKRKASTVPKTFAQVLTKALTPKKPADVKVPNAPKENWVGRVKERVTATKQKPSPTPGEMFLAGTKTPLPPKAEPLAKPRYTFPTPAELEIERAKDMERAGYSRPGLRDPQQTYTAKRRRQVDTEEHGMSKLDALLPGLDPASRFRAKQFMVAELGGAELGELRHIDGRILNGSGTKYKDAEEVARRFAQLYKSGKGQEIEGAIKSFVDKRQKQEELRGKMAGLQFSIRKSVIDANPYAATYLSDKDREELAQLPIGDKVDLNSAVWSKISENAKDTVNRALGVPGIRAAEESYKRMANDPNMSPLERGVAGIGAFGSMVAGLGLSQVGDLAGMAADIPGEVINVAETERDDPRKYGAIANLLGKAGAVAASAAGAGQGVKLAMQPAATLSGKSANVVRGIARVGYELGAGGPVPENLKSAGEKLADAVRAGDLNPEELRSVAEEVSQALPLDKARVKDFAQKIRKGAIEGGSNIDDIDAEAAATIVVAMEAKTKTKALDSVEIRGQKPEPKPFTPTPQKGYDPGEPMDLVGMAKKNEPKPEPRPMYEDPWTGKKEPLEPPKGQALKRWDEGQDYYHGHRAEIGTLEPHDIRIDWTKNLFGDGLYMTDDPSVASRYAKTGTTRGRIKQGTKLISTDDPVPQEIQSIYAKHLSALLGFEAELRPVSSNTRFGNWYHDAVDDLSEMILPEEAKADLTRIISEAGYDGIHHKANKRGGWRESNNGATNNVVILFDPTKSLERSSGKAAEAMPGVSTTPMPAATKTPEPVAKPEPAKIEGAFEQIKDTIRRLEAGEIKADELKTFAAKFRDSGYVTDLTADLNKLKKDVLLRIAGGYYRNSDTKPEIIKSVVRRLEEALTPGDSLTYGLGNGSREQAIDKLVATWTDDMIAARAEANRAAAAEKAAKDADFQRAVENPESLEDYQKAEWARGVRAVKANPELLKGVKASEERTTIRRIGRETFTPEQLETYDQLAAYERKGERDQEAAKRLAVEAIEQGVTEGMTLVETKHTKKGHDLFVVKLPDRVERKVYDRLNERAKKLGGNYSSYRGQGAEPGFQFKTRQAAEEFMSGEKIDGAERLAAKAEVKKEGRAAALRTVAESTRSKAEEVLSQTRLTNTARRAEMAAGTESAARADIALADTMDRIADAIESNKAVMLDQIRTKVTVQELQSVARSAQYQLLRKTLKHHELEEAMLTLKPEHMAKAEYPWPTVWERNFREAIGAVKDRPGLKRLAASAEKVYKQYANAEDFAEIRSHAHAETITELFTEAAKHVKYLGDAGTTRYKRIVALGWKSEAELRTGLREYVTFAVPPKAADPVKELERGLIGVDIPGFFPTPRSLAEDLVQKADIKPGMTVLEPSAGKGDLVEAVRASEPGANVVAGEYSGSLRPILKAKGIDVQFDDFLAHTPGEAYDRIVMNPPFEKGQDIDHVRHAYDLLKPGGKLVAIMSEGPFFRADRKATEFRSWLESVDGVSEKNPDKAFAGTDAFRQTGVATRTVEITKTGTEAPVNAPRETPGIVVTEAGGRALPGYARDGTKKYSMEWRVMSLDDVVQSHDPQSFGPNPRFPVAEDLQPGDRTRTESRVNVQKMAQTLDADLLLDDTKALTDGSPIVDSRGIVEHGNGRTMAVKLAQLEHPDKYEAYVAELRQRFPEAAEIENPVLVRVRTSELDPAEQKSYSRIGSTPTGQGMSTTETALADAQSLDDSFWGNLEIIGDNFEDTITAAANRGKITSFLAKIPESERAEFLDASGHLSEAGVTRIRNAAVFSLLGEDGNRFAAKAMESGEMSRRVYNGLVAALPSLLKYKTPNLVRTLNDGLTAWQEFVTSPFKTVDDYLAQQTMAPLTPRAKYVLEKLGVAAGPRGSGKQVAAEFNAMADLNRSIKESQAQDSMFGADEVEDLNEFRLFSRKPVNAMEEAELERWIKYVKNWGDDASEGLRQFNVDEDAIRVITAKAGVPYKPAPAKDINTGLFGEPDVQLDLGLFHKRYAPTRSAGSSGTVTSGTYDWLPEQRRGIVTFYETAQIDTAVHELMHHFGMYMEDKYFSAISKALGIEDKPMSEFTPEEYEDWQEFWARGVEDALFEGTVQGAQPEVQAAFDHAAQKIRKVYGEAGVPIPSSARGLNPTSDMTPVHEVFAQMLSGELKPKRTPPVGMPVTPGAPSSYADGVYRQLRQENPVRGDGDLAPRRVILFDGETYELTTVGEQRAYDEVTDAGRKNIRELNKKWVAARTPDEKARIMTALSIAREDLHRDQEDFFYNWKRQQRVSQGIEEDLDARFKAMSEEPVTTARPTAPKQPAAPKKPAAAKPAKEPTAQPAPKAAAQPKPEIPEEPTLPPATVAPDGKLSTSHLKTGFSEEPMKLSMSEKIKAIFFDDAIRAVTARKALEKSLAADMQKGSFKTLMGTATDISEAINKQARLGHKIEDYVKRGIRNDDGQRLSRGVLQIRDMVEASGIDLEKWQWYKRALRENEIYDQGRGGVVDRKRAEVNSKYVTEFLKSLTDDQTRALAEIDDQWRQLADAHLQLFERYGLKPEGWADEIRQENLHYFPLFSAKDSIEATMQGLNPQKLASPGVTVQRATGGTVYIDGFAAMAREIERVVRIGEATQAYLPFFKTAAAQAKAEMTKYLEAVKGNPNDPRLKRPELIKWVEDITPPSSEDKAMRTAAWGGSADLDPLPEEFIEGVDPILKLTENGEQRVYRIDPYLWAAIRGAMPAEENLAASAFQAVAKVARAGTTGALNPQFQLIFNPIVDFTSAMVTQGIGPAGWAKAFYNTVLRGASLGPKELYEEAAHAGVFTNSKGVMDYVPDEWLFDPSKKNQVQAAIEKASQARGIKMLRNGYEFLQYMGQTMEETTKLAAYEARQVENARKVARTQGRRLKDLSQAEVAAIRAENKGAAAMHAVSTMNFARSGQLGKFFARAGIPYAGIPYQVMLAHAKAIQRDPVKYMMRATALIGGPAAIEYALYHDDSEWKEMPAYLRHGAVLFRDGIFEGKPHEGDWIGIRIPEELGIIIRGGIFATMEKESALETGGMMAKEELEKFVPSMPTAIALLGQEVFNRNGGGVIDLRFYDLRAYPLPSGASDKARDKNQYKHLVQQMDTLFGSQGRMVTQVGGYLAGKQEKAPSLLQRFRPRPGKPKYEDVTTGDVRTTADIMKQIESKKPRTVADIIKGIKRQ